MKEKEDETKKLCGKIRAYIPPKDTKRIFDLKTFGVRVCIYLKTLDPVKVTAILMRHSGVISTDKMCACIAAAVTSAC